MSLLARALAALTAAALVSLAGCGDSESNYAKPAATAAGGTSGPAKTQPAGDLTIAVIPKGTTHEFWKSVEAGARAAGAELGVKIEWKGPVKESERSEQIAIVDQFVSDKVSGVVLAPLDDTALVRPVRNAVSRKIPVVIFDSALKGEVGKDFVSFVATDNFKGGQTAGEHLATLLNNKGKVVLLRYAEGSASTTDRENGFLSAVKKHPDLQVTVENRYGGATAAEAKARSLEIADKLKEADGVFACNESTTFGMLLALRQLGLTTKVKFVGFDASPDLLKGLEAGEIDALLAQNPRNMGHQAVTAIVKHIRGEAVEPRIDSGAALVTKANLNTDEVKKVLGK